MTSFIVLADAGEDAAFDDARLPVVAAAYLARFKGLSREHTDSDLRAFLGCCAERDIEPLQTQRAQLELYVRWMQETRRYKPSTGTRPGLSCRGAHSVAATLLAILMNRELNGDTLWAGHARHSPA